MIVTNHELADGLDESWGRGIEFDNLEIPAIGGKIYTGYSVGRPITSDKQSNVTTMAITPSGSIIRAYLLGRFVVYPLEKDEVTSVDPKWLLTTSAYNQLGDEMKHNGDYLDWFSTIIPHTYTNSFGAVSVHEKVHGIQDFKLPLPILEAAAHYYQLEVAKANGWYAKIGHNMEQFAKLYEQFVADVGEDAHRLIFGNIDAKDKKEYLLNKAKKIFTEENIQKASLYHSLGWTDDPTHSIFWETRPVEEIQDQITLNSLSTDIIENSGELGFSPSERKFIIGKRVLEAFRSGDQYRKLGAEKRFTHEFWHFAFAQLSKEEQTSLLSDFRTKMTVDETLSDDVLKLCGLLYTEDLYRFHFPTGDDDSIHFVQGDALGIKDDTLISIPNDGRQVFGAYLLTEILSSGSEGEFDDIEQYYTSVEPQNNPTEHQLWERKRALGKLACDIVSKLSPELIDTKFRSRTDEGIALLHKIADNNSKK